MAAFLLILALLLPCSFASAQDFTITKFHSDITISDDSSLTVKESITVEFHRPRHGVYREIPFRYLNELAEARITPLEVVSVTDEAERKWKYKVTRSGNVMHIRIGDPDKYVSGFQTYVITYIVENALLFFDDHDELYWNVTGNDWKAPIIRVSAKVHLAVEKKSGNHWAACYTGSFGSMESACSSETFGNIGEFFSKRTLSGGEGFTIAFGWDKGLVSPPPSWRKFLWTLDLKENWVFLFPLLSLAIIVQLWRKKGRDPRVRGSVTVMYGPPSYGEKPFTPAEVGALVDEKLDPRDITSTIVGLAVKGYLRIEEVNKEGLIFDRTDHYLVKVKEPDGELGPFERDLMGKIFAGSLSGILVSDMKNKFYVHLDTLKSTLYEGLVGKGYFLRSPEKVRRFYLIAALVAAVAVTLLGGMMYALFAPSAGPKNFVAGILAGLPIAAFSRVMPAKTKAGASAFMDILGFREFLDRAEKDRIERMGDKDLFSKFLPYAIALDVADNWAKAFERIYQNPPRWYVSPGGFRSFSPRGFTSTMNSVTSSLAAAMFSAPRGSGIGGRGGSSGGGSSGGGFGGGGGGSW